MLTEKERPMKSTSKLKKKQLELHFESEKDETDFRTTQDSKMISREEKPRPKKTEKVRLTKSSNK